MRAENILESAAKRGLKGPSTRGEYRVCCPFCERVDGKADTKFKLHMNASLGVYNCFKCGTAGKADLAFLGKPIPVPEIAEPKESLGPPEGYVPFFVPFAAGKDEPQFPESLKPYVAYVRARGVNVQHSRMGACLTGRYAGRVIIPHFAERNEFEPSVWIGFAARAIYPSMQPKYLYPAGMNRAGTIWSLSGSGTITTDYWITEGVFDALALWPSGIATFGKNVTDRQIEILVESKKDLVVCLDGDAWEDAQVLQMRLKLRGAESVRWCKLPPGTDPGSLGWLVEKYLVEP